MNWGAAAAAGATCPGFAGACCAIAHAAAVVVIAAVRVAAWYSSLRCLRGSITSACRIEGSHVMTTVRLVHQGRGEAYVSEQGHVMRSRRGLAVPFRSRMMNDD